MIKTGKFGVSYLTLFTLYLLMSCHQPLKENSGLKKYINDILHEDNKQLNWGTSDDSLTGTNDAIRFSHQAGFYELPFELTIVSSSGDIYYTLDGSTPDTSDYIYSGPVTIDRTMTIRARLYKKGHPDNKIFTSTYFIDDNSTYPVFSLSTNPENLWSHDSGIYVSGRSNSDTLAQIIWNSNYFMDWERDVAVEFFETDGRRILHQDAGLRIFGGITRTYPEKSLRIIARKKYGQSKFCNKFFEDKDISEFKNLVLRTSGNDYRWTRFRDAFTSKLIKSLGIDVQASRTVLLYVNGQYYGIYDLREKIDENFLESNHNADPTQTDILQGRATVEHGSDSTYLQMLNFIKKNSLENDSNFLYLSKMMEIRNYMNYIITEIYLCNIDSRGNVRFWRAGNLDGRFRWILYDTDYGFGSSMPASGNYLHDRLSPVQTNWYNPEWSTFLLRNLIKNKTFKNEFIQQSCHLLNTVFHTDTVLRAINMKTAEFEEGMDKHLKKNNIAKTKWYSEIDKIKNFAKERPGFLFNHLASEFGLSSTYDLNIQIEPENSGKVIINGNSVNSGFSGKYFKNVPLKIEASPNALYRFEKWEPSGDSLPILFLNGETPNIKAIMKKRLLSPYNNKIIFSEINPCGENGTGRDWIELFNNSNEDTDIGGWIFTDLENHFIIPSPTIIRKKECVIISRDTTGFRQYYLDYSVKLCGNLLCGLNRKSEEYVLLDKEGNIADYFVYKSNNYKDLPKEDFTIIAISPEKSNDFINDWILYKGDGTPGTIKMTNENFMYKTSMWQQFEIIIVMLLMIFWL